MDICPVCSNELLYENECPYCGYSREKFSLIFNSVFSGYVKKDSVELALKVMNFISEVVTSDSFNHPFTDDELKYILYAAKIAKEVSVYIGGEQWKN